MDRSISNGYYTLRSICFRRMNHGWRECLKPVGVQDGRFDGLVHSGCLSTLKAEGCEMEVLSKGTPGIRRTCVTPCK